MAESPVHLKDGGISDVLSEGQKTHNERVTPKMSENDTDHVRDVNGGLAEPQDGLPKTEQSSTANSDDVPSGKTSPKSFTGELDLTDPTSVIQMLENVDLTEEDTEDLLQEAYNMNRKLKEMLRRQEMESGSASKPRLKSRSKSNVESHYSNGHGSSQSNHTASSSSSSSRNGSSFGIRKVLPPIHAGERETSVYAIKLRRSKTNVPEMKTTTSDSSVVRTRSSTRPTFRKDSESPTRRRKASGARPEWNDRFNYS